MKAKEAKSGLILLIAMTVVNIINYGINLVLGRALGPAQFAEFHIVATLVLVLAFMGVAIQMTAAKLSASQTQQSFLSWLTKKVNMLSWASAIILVLLSPLLSSFFKFNHFAPFLVLAIGVPAYFSLCFYRGVLQGKQDFSPFAFTFIIETATRLVATILIIYWLADQEYIITYLAVCFLISFISSAIYARYKGVFVKASPDVAQTDLKPILWFVAFMALYEMSQIIISHSDVFLAKHFLSDVEAGQYASISLIGRMIYYGTWTFVMLLFPKVIAAKEEGKDPSKLLTLVSGIVLIIGLCATGFTYFFGEELIQVLFGASYLESAKHLYTYAAATTLFALGNVIVYYYLSLEKYTPVWLALLFGIGQIISIWNMHGTIHEIIYVQILLMGTLFVSLIAYHIYIHSTEKSFKDTSTNMSVKTTT